MKRHTLIINSLILMILSITMARAETGFSAYVVDHKTGRSLYEYNIHEKRYPASVTKVMTLYIIFEDLEKGKIKLDKPILISRKAASQECSCLGAKAGQTITLELAIKALIVKSANDVALAVAENLAGSEQAFVDRMNKTAKRLGMYNTNFTNPHGLFNESQVTTASDLIKLGIAIHNRFPQYYKLFTTKSFHFAGVQFSSHNRVNRNFVGADGIKTGYIRRSGFNLLTSAKQGKNRLFAVVLGGRTTKLRDDLMVDLLTLSFQQAKSRKIAQINPVITHDMTVLFRETKTVRSDKTRLYDNGNKSVLRKEIAAAPPKNQLSSANVMDKSQKNNYDPNESVAIQIGAYRNYNSAQNQARLVHRKIKKGTIRIVNSNDVYKAMLIGFNYDSAHSTCEMLKQDNTSCFIVRQQ